MSTRNRVDLIHELLIRLATQTEIATILTTILTTSSTIVSESPRFSMHTILGQGTLSEQQLICNIGIGHSDDYDCSCLNHYSTEYFDRSNW